MSVSLLILFNDRFKDVPFMLFYAKIKPFLKKMLISRNGYFALFEKELLHL